MTGRFRLPMLEEQAYEYLLAAYIMEVQLRYRRFIYNGFVEEQLKQVANCLTANTAKFGIVLCGGCGNGKTTMLKALQNVAAYLEIDTPMFSKIERGDRRAKRSQVIQMATYFKVDEKEMLTLWLADKILDALEDEDELNLNAIKIAEMEINNERNEQH